MSLTKIKNQLAHKIPALRIPKRVLFAMSYYNKRYGQIMAWGLRSKENTNFTYDLTEGNILYLAHTLSVVTGADTGKIVGYINELQNDSLLKAHVLNEINKSPLKEFADSRVDFGKRLGWYAMARIIRPKILIETGVDKGLGSVVLCAALLQNKKEGFEGHYYGTDINTEAGYLLTGAYKEVGTILFGDSIKSLSQLDAKIDMFINDSDHSADYEYQEYLTIKDKLSDNAIILGDNAHVNSKLAEFSLLTSRNFLFFREEPKDHWYPGGGIGISFKKM